MPPLLRANDYRTLLSSTDEHRPGHLSKDCTILGSCLLRGPFFIHSGIIISMKVQVNCLVSPASKWQNLPNPKAHTLSYTGFALMFFLLSPESCFHDLSPFSQLHFVSRNLLFIVCPLFQLEKCPTSTQPWTASRLLQPQYIFPHWKALPRFKCYPKGKAHLSQLSSLLLYWWSCLLGNRVPWKHNTS